MTPSPLNLGLNRTNNASVYTLATVNDEPNSSAPRSAFYDSARSSLDDSHVPHSARSPLLTPATPSYGATMPRSPGTARSSKKLIFNAALKMAAIFVVSTLLLGGTLWLALPTLEEEDRPMLRIPKSFEQLQDLNALLKKYRDIYPYRIVICYIIVYLFLQAFSLPGSMYLSILGGAVWGVPRALLLACCCVASGATLCYLISSALGPALLTIPRIASHLTNISDKVQQAAANNNLISYLIVLRIAPLPPHWVVNVVAPHVGIGIRVFWISTALGIFGVTVIHTTIGGGLDEMTSADDFHLISWKNFLGLFAIVVGVMVPVGLRYWFKRGGVTADVEGMATEDSAVGTSGVPRSATAADGTTVFVFDDEEEEEDQILAVGAPARLPNKKSKDASDSRTQLLTDELEVDDEEYTSEDDDGDIILEAGPELKSPKPLDVQSNSSA
ncbi:hypothetical protein GYMLUDRAFT_164681 [Collybiopsis luxurians FD-317 M1]|uniref:VTT domain-containing protein n=1 Tax=Collybiopsis luxurians FD-317 M1 TaxID=944289 RepID=A0A0D0CSQ2_9AGAR|nr:hypothetical protein GYMLUDRAFT_164681 [Collybiopsis luxurians FD-317 M1]